MPRQPNARLAQVMSRAQCSNTSLAARVQAVAREHGADLKCTHVDVVAQYYANDVCPLLDGRYTEEVGRRLFSAAAELAQQMGWAA